MTISNSSAQFRYHLDDDRVHCHALWVRSTVHLDAATLQRRLAAAVGPDERAWEEQVNAPASDSEQRRTREITRALAPCQSLRTVLLRYADEVIDLVLVARRTALDRASLYLLAAALLGDAAGARIPLVPQEVKEAGGGRLNMRVIPAPWWMGDRSVDHDLIVEQTIGIAVNVGGGSADAIDTLNGAVSWLSAIAITLARHGQPQPVLAVLNAPSAAGGAAGAGHPGHATIVQVEPDAAATVAGLGDLISATLAEAHATEGLVDAAVVFDFGLAQAVPTAATMIEYIPYQAPPSPLTFSVAVATDGTGKIRLHHRPYDVEAVSARKLLRQVIALRDQLLAEPSRDPATVDILAASDRTHILGLGRTERHHPQRQFRIEQVFAQRVVERPDTVALTSQSKRFSYRELDRWTDMLAEGLRVLGVRAGDRVGVCCERSAELVATLIAVLKAGACYVPIDAQDPHERKAYVASDAGLGIVVTTLTEFPALPGIKLLTPSELEKSARKSASPKRAADPREADDTAYIIYTSGTTGRPKGVAVPHQNVVDLVDATTPLFSLGPADVWTLFHSSAFDFSVWEIWGCLLTGGHLVVVSYWAARSPEQLDDVLRTEQVTVLSQTPSAFGQFVEAQRRRDSDLAVRLVVLGGEPLDARLLLPWFDRNSGRDCRVVNMFGITETTVHVTYEDMTRSGALSRSRVVGRALPGWSVRVLDAHGRIVPLGVPGEIHVGGAGIALEYLNRSELTEERFLPDPDSHGRLYRSGDRGRLLPDGRLEHLGRLDDQVKVHGFRIELDEIRSVLLEMPGVVAAAVVVSTMPHHAASSRISAYVVLDPATSEDGLRDQATRILPHYMVPASITRLSALPLTVNGKIDVAALVAEATQPTTAAGDVTGDVALDDLIAVWREVLGVDVRPDDDFFELGGNSIAAVRLGALLSERGCPSMHPRTLYLNPTVRRLACVLRSGDLHEHGV